MKDSIDIKSIYMRHENDSEIFNQESNGNFLSSDQKGVFNEGFVSLLDTYSCRGGDDNANESIESYIFDLVTNEKVEIKVGEHIEKGMDALCYLGMDYLQQPLGCISEMSYEALKLSIAKGFDSKGAIFEDLYKYNSRPLNSNLNSALKEVLEGFKDTIISNLGGEWRDTTLVNNNETWFYAQRKNKEDFSSCAIYKLYISVAPEQLQSDFERIIDIIISSKAIELKIPKQSHFLVRPDWFVVYFTNLVDLVDVSNDLRKVLAGLKSQGVPFTCQIGRTPSLSWGIDPPIRYYQPKSSSRSWRFWVVNRLTNTIFNHRNEKALRIIQLSLLRLKFDGVDIGNWTPPEKNYWNVS